MQHERKNLRTVLARSRAADWMRLLPANWVLGAAAAALVAALGYWYFFGTGKTEIKYATQALGRGDVTVTVRATGTIEPTDQVEISSELSGTMRFVDVDFNDTVKKGQILARLDTDALEAQLASSRATLAARQAKVKEIGATVAETKAAHNRAKTLHAKKFLSQEGLEQARATYERAVASLGSAKADVETAQADLKVSARRTSARRSTASCSTATWSRDRRSPRRCRRRCCSRSRRI